MGAKLNTEQFIKKAESVHGNNYDYSKVNYINNGTKVCIVCHKTDDNGNEHGEFLQLPSSHLSKKGCPKCRGKKISNSLRYSLDDFIDKARKIHVDKYDYSKVEYVSSKTKVCIICPKHGEFWQKPDNHLIGQGCPKCKSEKNGINKTKPWKYLLKEIQSVHGNKYEYDDSTYVNSHTKMKMICPTHGEFWQTPNSHLMGCACPKCKGKLVNNTQEFVEIAQKVHAYKYNYSKVNYTNTDSKVSIICPIHGEFLQRPHSHLRGVGCPYCNESHLEKEIYIFFDSLKEKYERNKRFKWLGRQSLDFYLPQYNIAIECQGGQHFGLGGWTKDLNSKNKIQTRDIRKKQLCEENGVRLLYFSHEKFDEFLGEKIYHNVEELMEEIKNS